MDSIQKKRLQVFRRVRDFLKPMAEEPTIRASFAELESVIERMTAEATRQDIHERQAKIGTDQVAVLARALRLDLLRPVLQLVKSVVPDVTTSELPASASLTLPKAKDRQGLITAATGLYETAKPYEAKLTAAGLPKDHLARLLAGSVALREAIDARAQNMLQRGAAVSTAQSEGQRAGRLLRLIDSLVQPLTRGDAGKVRAWGAAKRLGYGGSVIGGGAVTEGAPVVSIAPASEAQAVAVLSGGTQPTAGGAGEVARAA